MTSGAVPGSFRPAEPAAPTGPVPTPPQVAGPAEPAAPTGPVPTPPQVAEPVSGSGHPAVDGVIQAIANATALPPADQIAQFEAAHRTLQETLATIDQA